jgi:hypothetical protein
MQQQALDAEIALRDDPALRRIDAEPAARRGRTLSSMPIAASTT